MASDHVVPIDIVIRPKVAVDVESKMSAASGVSWSWETLGLIVLGIVALVVVSKVWRRGQGRG